MKNIGSYEVAVREIRSKDKREALHYWKDLLLGFNTRSDIPSFGNIPEDERCKVSELAIDVDEFVQARFCYEP